MPPRNHVLEPEARAKALASNPPVKDSATASVCPPCLSEVPTRSVSCSWLRCMSFMGTAHYPPLGEIIVSARVVLERLLLPRWLALTVTSSCVRDRGVLRNQAVTARIVVKNR